jgi:lipoprotein-releasing system permease protein
MKSEKFISFMILLFIMMVAAFNTVGSLYMLVIRKEKDMKIFASMGSRQRSS